MPFLVKGDDTGSGTKATLFMAGYGQHRYQWVKSLYKKTSCSLEIKIAILHLTVVIILVTEHLKYVWNVYCKL